MEYSKKLANRFVKDYSLPISVINEKNFNFQLDFYQERLNSRNKWESFCRMIDDDFNGDIESFIEVSIADEDEAVNRIKESLGYTKFNDADMGEYSNHIKDTPSKFNPESGKLYMSVDLVKANFQALKFFDKSIFNGYETYEQWISSFCKCPKTASSKYVRQVIFGKCNPSRQITVEKYIVRIINEHFSNDERFKLVSTNADELIYEVDNGLVPDGLSSEKVFVGETGYEYAIFKKYGFSVRCKFFKVTKHHLETESGHIRNGFYVKHFMSGKTETKCVEGQYAMIANCLIEGKEIPEECYHFNSDGLDCIINEKFIIVND